MMFVGEIVEITADEKIKPLVYHNGKYWKLGDNLPSPGQEILDGISRFADKYQKEFSEVKYTEVTIRFGFSSMDNDKCCS